LGVLTLACWLVTATFPLAAAPQSDGPGVAVDLGGANVLHRTAIAFPEAARGRNIQGDVSVELTLDGAGNVTDAKVIAGPEELRKAVLQSVLQWHFAREAGATRRVTVSFRSQTPVAPRTAPAQTQDTGRLMAPKLVAAQNSMVGKTVKSIRVVGVSDQFRKDLLARVPLHEGDIIGADTIQKATLAAKELDEHVSLSIGRLAGSDSDVSVMFIGPVTETVVGGVVMSETRGGVLGGIVGGVPGGVVGGVLGSVPAGAGEPPSPPDRIKVGGDMQQAKLVRQPRPTYPAEAKMARIQGVVKLTAVIGKDGTIIELAVTSGHPLLVPAALESVKQWVYQPTLLNGNPVEVATQIDVNFTLSQ
jgi:TonB family protein